jgi:hypothetical protein
MPRRFPALALMALCALSATAAATTPGVIDLPALPALAARATDATDLTVPGSLLRMLAGGGEKDSATKTLVGLNAVHIRSYTFRSDNAYSDADISRVRHQLEGGAWSRVVQAHSAADGERSEIYVCTTAETACGITLLVTEPREFTVINLAGSVPLDALRSVRQLIPSAGHNAH